MALSAFFLCPSAANPLLLCPSSKRKPNRPLYRTRTNEMRSAESRKKIIQRFLVRQINHREPQRHFRPSPSSTGCPYRNSYRKDFAERFAPDSYHHSQFHQPEFLPAKPLGPAMNTVLSPGSVVAKTPPQNSPICACWSGRKGQCRRKIRYRARN